MDSENAAGRRATAGSADGGKIAGLKSALAQAVERQQFGKQEFAAYCDELQTLNDDLAVSQLQVQVANRKLRELNTTLKKKVETLQDTRADLENLLSSSKIATLFLSTQGLIRRFSPETTALFELRDVDRGRPINDIAHCLETPVDMTADIHRVLARGGASLEHELRCIRENWYLYRVSAYRDVAGNIDGVVVTFENITELKQASQALEVSEARFRSLYDHNPTMYITLDAENCIRRINRHGLLMLDRDEADVVGRDFAALHAEPALVTGYLDYCRDDTGIQAWEAELAAESNGRTQWLRCRGNHVTGACGGSEILVVCENITAERGLRRLMEFRATHDEMTELVNRPEFERKLVAAARGAQKQAGMVHALCYMDLDDFKAVNELHGHRVGDELLRQVAQRLRDTIRKADVLARVGGDEFAVLLTFCTWQQAERVAEAMLAAMRDFQFECNSVRLRTGICIGVVPITETTSNAQGALRAAYRACQVAKQSGSNSIHLFDEEDAQTAHRQTEMAWATRVRKALADERVEIHAQPIIDLQDAGAAPGFESLIRLRSDNGGLWGPGSFLEPAARHGLLREIDEAVVRRVLGFLDESGDSLRPYRWLSINLSGSSLGNARFTRFLDSALRDSDVAAARLCFEITETTMISNLADARDFIEKFHALGCKFALDDFGSGLSSFHYLKSLPVDYIKIDGSFVMDILSDPVDSAMVESINEIAHIKGMQTIAEFIETRDVETRLRNMGVDLGQGYYYAAPEPIAKVMLR